jgi:hypothetical protein
MSLDVSGVALEKVCGDAGEGSTGIILINLNKTKRDTEWS